MATTQSIINGNPAYGLAVSDRGFAYGDGVFRTMRMHHGELIDWPLHYQTLVRDCSQLGIVCPAAELLMQDLKKMVHSESSAVIKVVITRGEGKRGYAPPAVTMPTRMLIQSPLPVYPQAIFDQGVALYVCDLKLGNQPKLAGAKHLNRLENVMARAECPDPAFFDGVLLNQTGYVVETTSSNIFARFGHVWKTPTLSQCGVAGVVREKILGLAQSFKLNIEVVDFDLPSLLTADEVLICNSMLGALDVVAIGEHQYRQGTLAKQLRVHWA